MKPTDDDRMRWILQWMRANGPASSRIAKFHDDFHAEFGGKRLVIPANVRPVAEAMDLLRRLYRAGNVCRTDLTPRIRPATFEFFV